MLLTALSLLSLTGCADKGAWLDPKEMSCGANPYDWFGGLSLYLDSGEVGEDAVTFNYASPYGYIKTVAGRYNTSSGDYNYSITYNNYLYEKDVVVGYGTVYHNGAVDLLETVERTDLRGNVTSWQVREERYGCEGLKQTFTDPAVGTPELIDETSYRLVSADQVGYSRDDDDGGGLITGKYWRDLTHTYVLDYGDSFYAEGTEYSNGDREDLFEAASGDVSYSGSVIYYGTGDIYQSYMVREVGSPQVVLRVVKSLNPVGAGSATFSYTDGDVCEITYTLTGECEAVCTGSGSGTGTGDDCDPETSPPIRSL